MNSNLLSRSYKTGEIFYTAWISTILHIKFVSNSQFLLIYSQQSLSTFNGIATNWDVTSLEEMYPPPCKFSVTCLTHIVVMSPGQYDDE